MSAHDHSLKPYVLVLVTLFGLTLLTVAAAYIDFGHPWSDLVALGIAITKATLVVLYFMHARYAGGLTRLVILSSAAFFFILVFLTMSDYVTRSWSLTVAG